MRSRRTTLLICAADILWIAAAMYLAYECRYGFVVSVATVRGCIAMFGETTVAALLIWTFLTSVMKLDGFSGGWSFRSVLSDLLVGVFLLMVLLLANGYLTRVYHSRLVFVYFSGIVLAGFLVIRWLAKRILSSRRFGTSRRRVVILGGGRIARELTAKIRRHPEMRWEIVGYLCPEFDSNGIGRGNGDGNGNGADHARIIRTLDVVDFLTRDKVDEVIVAVANPARQMLDLVAQCQRSGIQVLVVPQSYELYISRPRIAELDGLPFILLSQYGLPAGGQMVRRLTDFVVLPFLLLAGLPVLLPAAAILLLRKGKAFQRELRCGKGGKTFWMYRLNVDRNLPTVPAYEKLLTDLGFTELPQLWNVVRGDMDLVGPRPEAPDRVKHYSDWQRQRMKIKPGITGLAQIHGLRDQHSAEQKTHYDLQYILRWSPFLDLSLALQTGWILLARVWSRKAVRTEAWQEDVPWPEEAETPLEEVAYVDHP